MSNYVSLLELLYPIGSVYMSTNSTSPANIIGGGWSQISANTMLGAGNGYAGSHSITTSNMPAHGHNFWAYYYDSNSTTNQCVSWGNSGPPINYTMRSVDSSGGGASYTPYYYGVNIWIRTS